MGLTSYAGVRHLGRTDFAAGLSVALVVFPLSFCAALASGFPPSSGLIASFVGVWILSIFSSSPLSVKAPGIDLSAVVLIALSVMSPYPKTGIQYTLATLVLAGAFLILFGLLKLGKWHSLIPDALLYGLSTAIGIMVITRMMYYLLGLYPGYAYFTNLIVDFPFLLGDIRAKDVFLGLASLFILMLPDILGSGTRQNLPAVFIVFLLGMFYGYYESRFGLQPLVPMLGPLMEKGSFFIRPDFSILFSWQSIEFAFLIAFVIMSESLVNNRSLESLDIFRRSTEPNRELILIGFGTSLSALLGGLPLLVNMVSSTVSVNYGAKTRWSGIVLAISFTLIFLILSPLISYIPLSCLAALMIYLTYRLNSFKLIRGIYEIGYDQLIVYLSTIIFTLVFGVAYGIIGGIVSNFLVYYFLGSPLKYMFWAPIEQSSRGKNKVKLSMKGAALASNFWVIQNQMNRIEEHQRLIIDLSDTYLVDHSFLELIYSYAHFQKRNDGKMELQGLKNHQPISRHPLASIKKSRKQLASQSKMGRLLNERQIDIQALASINNVRLEPNLSYDGIVLQGFAFAFGYEIRYRENKFMKFYDGNTFEFSDVFLSKGLRMSEQSHKISVILLTLLELPVPNFTLGPENLVDKVWQSFGYEDIDFNEYPGFSENFLLNGENPDAIRQFFTSGLIYFLEKNQGVSIEARNNRLLFYRERTLLSRIEIEDMINVVEGFIEIVSTQGVTTEIPE